MRRSTLLLLQIFNIMKRFKYILLLLFAYSSIQLSYAQKTDRIKAIETELKTYSGTYTNLNNEVDLSVSNSSLKEFIRGIALANELNVTIAPDITNTITNNFSKAKVLDVFVQLILMLHRDGIDVCKALDYLLDII